LNIYKNIGIRNIFKMDFKRKLKSTLIWTFVMILIGLVYYGVYPSMKDLVTDKLNSMPPEILNFVSSSGELDMSDFNYYFAMIFSIIQIPLFIYASSSGSSLLHDEEKSGSIEYLYSQDVSRNDIYISKALVSLVNLIIIFFSSFLVAVVMGKGLSSDTFSFNTIKNCFLFSFCGIFFFFSLGLFLSSLLDKHKEPSKICVGLFLGGYLLGYISLLIDNINFLKIFSPIHLISSDNIAHSKAFGIGEGDFRIVGPLIYLILSFILIIWGKILYNKKDLT